MELKNVVGLTPFFLLSLIFVFFLWQKMIKNEQVKCAGDHAGVGYCLVCVCHESLSIVEPTKMSLCGFLT